MRRGDGGAIAICESPLDRGKRELALGVAPAKRLARLDKELLALQVLFAQLELKR